jgi:hypothetical protein
MNYEEEFDMSMTRLMKENVEKEIHALNKLMFPLLLESSKPKTDNDLRYYWRKLEEAKRKRGSLNNR